MARLALASCDKLNMCAAAPTASAPSRRPCARAVPLIAGAPSRCRYGFSLEADDFHYFDSMVQEKVRPAERDPNYGVTHKFAREHEVYRRWAREMPDRVEIFS